MNAANISIISFLSVEPIHIELTGAQDSSVIKACTSGLDIRKFTAPIIKNPLSTPHYCSTFNLPPSRSFLKTLCSIFPSLWTISRKRNLRSLQSYVQELLLHFQTLTAVSKVFCKPHNWNTLFFTFYYHYNLFLLVVARTNSSIYPYQRSLPDFLLLKLFCSPVT